MTPEEPTQLHRLPARGRAPADYIVIPPDPDQPASGLKRVDVLLLRDAIHLAILGAIIGATLVGAYALTYADDVRQQFVKAQAVAPCGGAP
jgi:hypothetical protein